MDLNQLAIQQLQQQVLRGQEAVLQQLLIMNANQEYRDVCAFLRECNAAATPADIALYPLPTAPANPVVDLAAGPVVLPPPVLGPAPIGFPATRLALGDLTGDQIDHLLQAYGLPGAGIGTVPARRRVLCKHIGALPL